MPGCPICDRQISSAHRYKRHLLRHGLGRHARGSCSTHPQAAAPHMKFVCTDCGKRLLTQSTLMQHRLTHTKPFKCSICSKRFSQRVNLLDHERAHTGEQPFSCNVCDRRFSQQANLHTHRKIHQAVRDFHCSMCFAGFVQKINLINHLKKRHSVQLPFCCPRCSWGSDCGFCSRCSVKLVNSGLTHL